MTSIEVAPVDLLARLGAGRETALRASELGAELGVSERTVGALAAALIDEGYLVGSTCGSTPGYFLITNEAELEEGTRHIRSRAIASLARLSKLRSTAKAALGPQTEALFDVSEYAR
jgi:hypothetical protein